jgi:hypothetical protein
MTKRTKWWWNGAAGAFLFGSGLSIAMECSQLKHSGEPWYIWAVGGTAGIGIALSGVVLLIRAGILNRELQRETQA